MVCVQFLPAIWQGRPSALSESSPHENILIFRELQRLISDPEQIFTALTETSALTSSFPVSQSLMREIPAEVLAFSGSSSQGFTEEWPQWDRGAEQALDGRSLSFLES